MGIFQTLRGIGRGASAARTAPANQAASARSAARGGIRSPFVRARQARANALRPYTDAKRGVDSTKGQARNLFGRNALGLQQDEDAKAKSKSKTTGQTAEELVVARPRGGKAPGLPRVYRRYPHRRTTTDFFVSALLYPIPIFPLIGGIFADWDTVFIRYHLVHARMLWVFMLLPPFFPFVTFPMWIYMWWLGFRAYSGKRSKIPFLTWYAERIDKVEPDPRLNHNAPVYKKRGY